MGNILYDSFETYISNLKLMLLFSIPFLISILIPLFTPLPSFMSLGGIFLRTASVFTNMTPVSIAVIIISLLISLLFLSFAFVAISLIVKSSRTKTQNPLRILSKIEAYTSKVFIVFIFYTVILFVANIAGYMLGIETLLTALVGFLLFIAIFYAPTAIVFGDKGFSSALKDSFKLMKSQPGYFATWLLLLFVVLSVLDYIFIAVGGTIISQYLLLIVNSLVILPYFVIFQAEAYMKKYNMLRH